MTNAKQSTPEVATSDHTEKADIAYVVPVHNGAIHLKAALTSLAEQTLPPRKVYIFENGSTDDTVKIALSFVQRYPNFEIHPAPEFLSAKDNFDRAFAYAVERHAFFACLAHDDEIARNYIEVLFESLATNPNALVAVGNVVKSGGGKDEPVPFDPNILDRESYSNPERGFKRIVFPASWFYGLYRGKSALDLLQHSWVEFPHLWGGDRMMTLHFLLRGQLVYSPKTYFKWGVGSDSFRIYAEKRALGMLKRRIKYHVILWSHRSYLHLRTPRARIAYWSLCYHTAAHDTYKLEPLVLGKYRKLHRR